MYQLAKPTVLPLAATTCRLTEPTLLSPVTMMTLMPALWQVLMAERHSERGGSCMPSSPMNVSPLSSVMSSCGWSRECRSACNCDCMCSCVHASAHCGKLQDACKRGEERLSPALSAAAT